MRLTGLILAASVLTLAACASVPEQTPPRHEDTKPVVKPQPKPQQPQVKPAQPKPQQPKTPAQPVDPQPEITMSLTEVGFADLPAWDLAGASEALEAFKRHCVIWSKRGSYTATYAGKAVDFRPACDAAAAFVPAVVDPIGDAAAAAATPSDDPGGQPATAPADPAKAFFEANFTPFRIDSTGGQAKMTAYYLPKVEVRAAPQAGFTEPFRSKPADMLVLDLDAFEQRLGASWAAAAPASIAARVENGKVVPYKDRAAISAEDRPGFAYAHPADVYNIQVQGSGRLRYPDGLETCASFSAQNGFKWNSALGAVSRAGALPRDPGGTWASLKRFWTDNPGRVRSDLNVDPSYVFFAQSDSPDACPRGSSGALLVGKGSAAIDPRFHVYGTPLYLFAEGTPLLPRVLVAQDTGGAIRRGPLRADFYVGEGPEAGLAAERTSVDNPSFFALLPKVAAPVGPVPDPAPSPGPVATPSPAPKPPSSSS